MTINNPFIKDKDNIKWLEDNYETFLDYMAKHHSLADCWHTILDLSTFDDKYISNMITKVTAADNKKIKEAAARKRKLGGKKTNTKSTTIEKKQSLIEEAIEEKKRKSKEEDELLD